ncbi:pleckstrin -like protein [Labeo rohita]|uniref:Pleckstrin-like protein n=1 Tax=Labeo rohita TaxID=84645 RepID=A0A498LU51_LABRO|nr:pleckstrin -like protein [Labeo rohita]
MQGRATHWPDGASVSWPVYRSSGHGQNEPPAATTTLQINSRPGLLTRSPAKLPRYSGLMPLEPYLAQVDLAALHDRWSCEEAATHLALALEGPALQVLIDLFPEERCDLQALTAALNRHFGQRTSAEQSREELTNRRRREEESVAERGVDRFQPEEEEVNRAQPALTPRRRSRLDRCFRCGEPGHFARDCPAPYNIIPRKRPWSEAVRGPSPRFSAPLHNDCPTVGRCGLARGLYLDCVVDGQPCSALVETGSTICLLRKGLLPGTVGPLPEGWTPTNTELLTVTGERTVMPGKKLLSVVVGTSHEFWLTDIRDEGIVGLDLLANWGAHETVAAVEELGVEVVSI